MHLMFLEHIKCFTRNCFTNQVAPLHGMVTVFRHNYHSVYTAPLIVVVDKKGTNLRCTVSLIYDLNTCRNRGVHRKWINTENQKKKKNKKHTSFDSSWKHQEGCFWNARLEYWLKIFKNIGIERMGNLKFMKFLDFFNDYSSYRSIFMVMRFSRCRCF